MTKFELKHVFSLCTTIYYLFLGRLLRLWNSLIVLLQNTDTSILPYSIGNFRGINPHSELTWESLVQEGRWKTTAFSCLTNYRVHFTIYPYTPVPRPLEWFLWKPMVSITPPQYFNETVTEFLELWLTNISPTKSYKMYQKIGCR